MVLFKRKVVRPLPPPPLDDLGLNHDVWYIKATGEFFLDYDDYLKRMDFYNQRRFICEITGHSNLSFFDALESEMNEARDVDEAFPESLKEPVLRRLQFSTTSRLDHLVDEVYDAFRHDYYPGEFVFATISSEKFEVVIREKAQFNAIQLPTGEVRPAYAKYRVEMVTGDRAGQEEFVDQIQITRDRKRFSKSMLRTFMKNSISRESWSGAPWLVKHRYAIKYRIDTNVPPNLQKNGGLTDAEVAAEQALKAKRKRVAQQAEKQRLAREREDYKDQIKRDKASMDERDRINRELAKRPVSTEDLDIISIYDPPAMRPKLKFETAFSQDLIGLLLETWSFINMFHEPLLLSLITFDDFVGCLQYSTSEQPCELLVELFCSMLKQVIGKNDTEFLVEIPPNPNAESDGSSESSESESGSVNSESRSSTEEPSNRLSEMQKWREGSWKVRLQRRLFINGGMELIIISLLDEISHVARWHYLCKEIVDFVAPPDLPATLETARIRFSMLSKDQKLKILALFTELVSDSGAIRDRIEFCMEESTRIRRERLETHKEHKALLESIRSFEEEREALITKEEEESSSENSSRKTKSRPAATREEIESSLTKSNSAYKKILRGIETAYEGVQRCIATLKQTEIELPTLDCQRIRPLGRDRFYNRYWWFEGNGVPADLGARSYLMGRLWVQGPSEEDLEVFVKNGMAMYGEMTLTERKDIEVDKECQLNDRNEWAFYDDPADIKELYYWLSVKGQREPRFRKDLDVRRQRIEAPMAARRRYLGLESADSDKQSDSHEISQFGDDDEPLRRSSRQREKIASLEVVGHIERDLRFLAWRNYAAIEALGRTHFETAYRKTGDVAGTPSVNFATPASAAASVTGSAKPSPQPSTATRPSTPMPVNVTTSSVDREVVSDRETRAERRAAEAQAQAQAQMQAQIQTQLSEREKKIRLKRTASMASIEGSPSGDSVRRSTRQTRHSVRLES
ncbi:ATP-utilizing chromatin assembly and remodelling N-terminal-domain-containing protein [Lipomyces arxii]|uniref:ATP-utilizing chromatin assembly and remodelling N-terminal-domain-containing protein n=1 Tax=Lipomyces arxii TaxID=56418 RepID=UPI0034CED453